MTKVKLTMPEKDEGKSYDLVPEGERSLEITDVLEKPQDMKFLVKCRDAKTGSSLLHSVTVDMDNKFFWLTKLFLGCIGEPNQGQIEIDTDAWIGRKFWGIVKHKDGFANIKKMIPGRNEVKDKEEVEWDKDL